MTALGDKIRAKQLAEKHKVPVAPWAIVESPDAAVEAAETIGFPSCLKPPAVAADEVLLRRQNRRCG